MNSDESQTPDQEVNSTSSDSLPPEESQPLNLPTSEPLNTEEEEAKIPLNLPNSEVETPESEASSDPIEVTEESTPVAETPSTPPPSNESIADPASSLSPAVAELEQQKQALQQEISALQEQKSQLLTEQMAEMQQMVGRMIQEGTKELESRKQALQVSVEQLERRRERIQKEMRTSFAGASQDMAMRVQGFKDYLVGSLQDLSAAAEQLELPTFEERKQPQRRRSEPPDEAPNPKFAKQGFQDQTRQIRRIIDQYRTRPDYYGPPWQLRRTFEPIHAERVSSWFFSQGGRGAMRSMGSRLQNILVASTTMAILHNLYGERVRILVLANTPERLGEWRRGLQDCLGISRSDFGPDRGVTLFESPEAAVQRADRLVERKKLPFIIIDETEDQINLSLLQFPLWLAFAPDPQQMSSYMY